MIAACIPTDVVIGILTVLVVSGLALHFIFRFLTYDDFNDKDL